jgi:photosystem II stability/assembly factor-like uncharacterized protein
VVESDRVDPSIFYGFSGGTFYVSTDGGATFTASATDLPSSSVHFKAVPGRQGDIWLAGGSSDNYGLWHSSDTGATFTRIENVDEADTIGFGKARPGAGYPALYTSGEIAGVRGIYRSDDAGQTWSRINDDQHQWGWTGATITGDPRVYGRVYVGTNGRGVIYGDLSSEIGEPKSVPTVSSATSTTKTTGPAATSIASTWLLESQRHFTWGAANENADD